MVCIQWEQRAFSRGKRGGKLNVMSLFTTKPKIKGQGCYQKTDPKELVLGVTGANPKTKESLKEE